MTFQILKRRTVEAGVDSLYRMTGQYRLIVRRQDGSIRQDTGFFDNLILDAGLNRLGSGASYGRCEIGTSAAPVASTQTSLAGLAAATTSQVSSTYSAASSAPYYEQNDLTYRFAIGSLNGNYTEIGIGWAANTLFSRAIIVDSGGNPTSVTVLSTEQLDVVYRLRMYHPSSDFTGTFTIGGVSTDVVGRACNATASTWTNGGSPLGQAVSPLQYTNSSNYAKVYTGTIGAVTAAPSGTAADANALASLAGYSNNSYTRAATVTLALGSGNIGGIRSLAQTITNGLLGTQWQFTPAIAKDNTKTLALTISATWARRP